MLPFKSGKCRLTSNYGYRTHPVTGQPNSFHGGIDLVGVTTSQGADNLIRAVCDGTVVRSRIVTNRADATWQWGNYIAISGTDGTTIYYCHLRQRLVNQGQHVNAGDVIGYEGSTGQVTGQHLHFECRNSMNGRQFSAADYLGIANAVGVYSDVPEAVQTVAEAPISAGGIDTGNSVRIVTGAVYKNGKRIPPAYVGKPYTVVRISGDYALIKEVYSWVNVKYLAAV